MSDNAALVQACTGCAICCIALPLLGGAITLLVFACMALKETSKNEQKDLCSDSNAWDFILAQLVASVGLAIILNIIKAAVAIDKNGDPLSAQLKLIILPVLFFAGFAGWGIHELWGVDCVDELKGKLLYPILYTYTIFDIVVLGFVSCAVCSAMCTLCGVSTLNDKYSNNV